MGESSFNPHAKILHRGQYFVKKSDTVAVPIRTFLGEDLKEQTLLERVAELNAEIEKLEFNIDRKKMEAEQQYDQIVAKAYDEARRITEEAEQHAFDKIQQSNSDKDIALQKANEEAEKIILNAKSESQQIASEAKSNAIEIENDAKQLGSKQGYEQGLQDGLQDIQQVVNRLHSIVAETAREREQILIHSEDQVINLVLTMVRKVVKKLTTEHQDIVVENTKSALDILRGAMTIFVRVSSHDFNYLSSFREQLISMIESRADLKFVEDPTVEPGGVYIETEMGDIDATIRSQLEELTNQMHFYMPVKVKTPEIKRRENLAQYSDSKIEPQPREIEKTPMAQNEVYTQADENLKPTQELVSNPPEDIIINETSEPNQEYITPLEINESPETATILSDNTIQEAIESYKNLDDPETNPHDEDLTV